jgi:hypothetical protein
VSGNDEFTVRNVAMICPDEGTRIWIDHLWEAQPAEDGHPDPGQVGIMLEVNGESASLP